MNCLWCDMGMRAIIKGKCHNLLCTEQAYMYDTNILKLTNVQVVHSFYIFRKKSQVHWLMRKMYNINATVISANMQSHGTCKLHQHKRRQKSSSRSRWKTSMSIPLKEIGDRKDFQERTQEFLKKSSSLLT